MLAKEIEAIKRTCGHDISSESAVNLFVVVDWVKLWPNDSLIRFVAGGNQQTHATVLQ